MDKKHEIVGNIYQTSDYGFFKHLHENRKEKTRKTLQEDLIKNGQIMPILCDANGNVEDGSNRLRALEQLGMPVKYIVTNKPRLTAMRAANGNQKPWTIKDHVESFAKEGKMEYIRVLKASKQSGISVNYICEIASNRNNEIIRKGEFKSNRWESVFEFIKYHKRFKSVVKTWGSQGFVNALFHLYSIPKINRARLFEKVARANEDFQNIEKKSVVIEKMLNLYNQNLKNEENRIEFYFNAKRRIVINEEMSDWLKEEEKKAI